MGQLELETSSGKIIIIDESDLQAVQQFNWYAHLTRKRWYAVTNLRVSGGHKTLQMHTYLTGYRITDHKNGNGLDNRRCNLREATGSQNMWNTNARGKASIYKGVTWHKASKSWMARITINYNRIHLGIFKSEAEAAISYDLAARKYHGKYGRYNFPNEDEQSAIKMTQSALDTAVVGRGMIGDMPVLHGSGI